MARRGKDLFQALQRRQSGVPPEPEGGALSDIWERAQDLFAGWTGSGKPKRGKKRGKKSRGGLQLPEWLPVAAMVVLIFGAGFGVGRWSGGAAKPVELRQPGGDRTPRRAREFADGASTTGRLDPAAEEKVLSSSFFPVMVFRENRRSVASQVAAHFRAHGVATVRIRHWPEFVETVQCKPWVVLAYVPEGVEVAAIRDSVLAVPDSDLITKSCPRWRQQLPAQPQQFAR